MTITTEHVTSSYGQPVILDDDDQPMDFGPGVQAVRRRLGLSTTQLAEECGVSRRTVENWEGGRNLVSTPALLVMARLLDSMRV